MEYSSRLHVGASYVPAETYKKGDNNSLGDLSDICMFVSTELCKEKSSPF
jgi:hypothetical protein